MQKIIHFSCEGLGVRSPIPKRIFVYVTAEQCKSGSNFSCCEFRRKMFMFIENVLTDAIVNIWQDFKIPELVDWSVLCAPLTRWHYECISTCILVWWLTVYKGRISAPRTLQVQRFWAKKRGMREPVGNWRRLQYSGMVEIAIVVIMALVVVVVVVIVVLYCTL
jgi:hypothetical protein